MTTETIVAAPKRRVKRNYVNNPDFCAALEAYRDLCREAEAKGQQKPQITKYIGECFYQMATRIATKPMFSGYSYREDMVLDGIERCVTYIGSFNPDVTRNPFAYFTRCIYNAYWNRIKVERKYQYDKYKMMLDAAHERFLYDDEGPSIYNKSNLEYAEEYIKNYEELEAKKKKEKEEKRKAEKEALALTEKEALALTEKEASITEVSV